MTAPSVLAELTVDNIRSEPSFLMAVATVRNLSAETGFTLFAEPGNYVVMREEKEFPWRYVATSGYILRLQVEPLQFLTWETTIPISSQFERLGTAHPGYVELLPGRYRLQLRCSLEWLLPVGPFSPAQRADLAAGRLPSEIDSNRLEFDVP